MRAVAFAVAVLAAWEGASAGLPSPIHPDGHLGVLFTRAALDVAPDRAGRLETIRVRLGDAVRRGDVLATLEDRDARLERRMAQADLAAARAARDKAEAELALAAEAHARRERAPELFSAEEIVSSREQERIARAALEMAAAAVRQHEARVERAAGALERSVLLAPFGGTVAARYREPGEHVAAGTAVLRLAGAGEAWIRFAVPAEERARLAPGSAVEVRLTPHLDPVGGTIRHVAPEIDAPSGMAFAEAMLDAPLPEQVAPGGTVRVRLLP